MKVILTLQNDTGESIASLVMPADECCELPEEELSKRYILPYLRKLTDCLTGWARLKEISARAKQTGFIN